MLLVAKGLRLSLGRRRRRVDAVNDVDLSIDAGDRLALVGPSGAGKSSLASLLVGLRAPDRGEVRFEGRRLSPPLPASVQVKLQMLFQDAGGALDPRWTARRCIEVPLRLHRRAVSAVADDWARRVGLAPDRLERRAPELSGGERQRVALARSLALAPRVLVLDEPTMGLDAGVAAGLRATILLMQRELRLGLVWITHDLAEAARVAPRLAVLEAGRIVESGTTASVLTAPEHPCTQRLVAAARSLVFPPGRQLV